MMHQLNVMSKYIFVRKMMKCKQYITMMHGVKETAIHTNFHI